jgi:tetratricopeptide (TPR) repeat protein
MCHYSDMGVAASASANEEKIKAACLDRLSPSDWRRLQSARSAIERNEYSWAKFELDNISEVGRAHPQVLELSVTVHAGLQNHGKTIEIAEMLINSGRAFDSHAVWVALADALHQVGRTEEAYDALKAFVARTGHIGLVHYRLAVYACLLGRPEAARAHFERAMQTPEGNRLKQQALADDRLRDIWEFLCNP